MTRWMTATLLGIGELIAGCKESNAVWRQEKLSPDATWIANAITEQNGGFGSASIDTTVSLSRNGDAWSKSPTEVLGFSCDGPIPRPYVLDNVANQGGGIGLRMKWVTPTHLDVTYRGNADLYFQAIQFAGVTISVENVPETGV